MCSKSACKNLSSVTEITIHIFIWDYEFCTVKLMSATVALFSTNRYQQTKVLTDIY